ncbi:hypothetical protein CY35_05G023200 [Sphagnum magellanicum]|nr:hypothetical protein CY35_05G023200 [Sphagnum magellanicum]
MALVCHNNNGHLGFISWSGIVHTLGLILRLLCLSPSLQASQMMMSTKYLNEHEDIQRKFLNRNDWPKYVLVHYTWVEKSEINVAGCLFVLFGSGKWINIRWTVLHTLNFVSPWKTCNFS